MIQNGDGVRHGVFTANRPEKWIDDSC